MILISACLGGQKVRYNGTDCLHLKIQQLVKEKRAIMVCPEVMGGLPTPRNPAEIIGGDGYGVLDGKARVMNTAGEDVTQAFLTGAKRTLERALELGATTVVLKESSPSCGGRHIYSGRFDGTKVEGEGVTAALLKRHGIRVLSEDNFLDHIEEL